MLNRFKRMLHRRGRLAVLAAALLCVFAAGPAFAETRSLKLYFMHTKERATITYKKNGRYLPGGLKKINRFLRDWRRNEPTKMDPRLLDLLWEVYRATGARKHIHVVSAYRSPQTNAMLRKRSRGVATKSQHMLGRAIDFYIPDVPLKKLRRIGMQAQVGGVGYYPRSGSPFVHLDVGSVRSWPRMNRKELSRVFPKGKTLHLPTDGKPLPGYKQAMADYKKRVSKKTIQIAGSTRSSGGGNLLGGLLGRNGKKDEAPAPTPAAPATAPAVQLAFIPTPQPRPEPPADAGVQLAALVSEETTGEIPLPQSLASRSAVIPESGGVAIAADTSTLVSVASATPDQSTNAFGVSAPGLLTTQQARRAGRVTLASAQPNVTAGALLLAPATAQPADAGLTVAPGEPQIGNSPVDDLDSGAPQLAFVPRPSSRPISNSSAGLALAAVTETEGGEGAIGIPVPTPSPFGSLRGQGEMIALPPVQVALAPQSTDTSFSGGAVGGGIMESAFAPVLKPSNGKGGRPDAQDAAENRRSSVRKAPVLTKNLVTRRTFATNRVAVMQGPGKAPHFVSAYMRTAPDTVHMDGFSQENRIASADAFSGRAVNFMTVARFVQRN
ncbi:MAG: DUF882 domain-containing protein [Alphaproteobacteria bacterium]|nr:DUF882 domain-containing protein [Alphaproteobacteria bacterium]